MAEDRGDMKTAVRCYVDLVTAYVQGGESTRVIAPFAWLERNYKENPQWFDDVELPGYSDGLVHQLGWFYKYVFSAARELPNVSVAQTEQILQRMHDFYQQQSDPQRAWYFRNYEMYRRLGEKDKAEGFYQQWLNADRSDLSDCALCDPGHQVDYFARLEQWDKAIEIGEEALGAESQCSNQPEQLLSDLMLPWLYSGRDDKAWAAHLRAYRRYQQSASYLQNLDQQLVYLAVSGRAGRPERLERALTISLRHTPWMKEAESPRVLLDFAIAVVLVLDSFDTERGSEVLDVTLPGEELPWISAPQLVRPTLSEARQWFYQLAVDLTEQFAQRPGHPHPEREMERLNEILNPKPAPEPTTTTPIPDVSGMKISEALPKPAASDVVDDEELSTLESEPGLSAEQLSGPWKDLSLRELLEADAKFGAAVNTIYWMQALEHVVAAPELLNDDLDGLTETARAEWDQLRAEANELLYEADEAPDRLPEVVSDPAFTLIAQAERHMKDKEYMEAAQSADEALGHTLTIRSVPGCAHCVYCLMRRKRPVILMKRLNQRATCSTYRQLHNCPTAKAWQPFIYPSFLLAGVGGRNGGSSPKCARCFRTSAFRWRRRAAFTSGTGPSIWKDGARRDCRDSFGTWRPNYAGQGARRSYSGVNAGCECLPGSSPV